MTVRKKNLDGVNPLITLKNYTCAFLELLFLFCTCIAQAQNAYRTDKDISYVSGSETDTYRLEPVSYTHLTTHLHYSKRIHL